MIKKTKNEAGTFFCLGNDTLSLILRIRFGKAELVHFGAPLPPEDASALCTCSRLGWGCSVLYEEGNTESCLDEIPLCWSESGTGDYRESSVELLLDGVSVCPDFVFFGYEELLGTAPALSVLPRADGAADTLKLCFTAANDTLQGLELELYFSLFETALTRRTVLRNNTGKTIGVTKLMSSCTDLKGDFVMTTFNGGWIRETHLSRIPVGPARVVNESVCGFSSNRHNTGFLLSRREATEDTGEVYGFNLLWSGNHRSSAQKSPVGFTRVLQGISPEGFLLELEPGNFFETPEAVISRSGEGFNGLSRLMHRFISEHIVPAAWRGRERPVLYNSWEGCLFHFTEQSLLGLARKAKRLGCELFVLDDGWFGARNSDTAGLGDYTVNRKKLPGGIEGLAKKVNSLGMQFGLWFEPEAVNSDSDCFRAHPDWVLHSPGSRDLQGRNELLLDLANPEVQNYIVESVGAVLDSAPIAYVKWDMNRCSCAEGAQAYRHILGLYEILRRIFEPRPDILLEGCASGGNRFDPGMLCFAPQIWASDNTDPIERLDIQKGLSYLYPLSTMGAHISEAPHSQTLRNTPLSTRANAAFFGDFGLEFDLNHMLPVDETELEDAVTFYKTHRKTFQFGTFSRLPAEEGAETWQVSTEEETICGVFHRLQPAGTGQEWLTTCGLNQKTTYKVEARNQLLRVGQFGGLLKYITPVAVNPNGAVLRTADRHYRMYDGGFSAQCSGAALNNGIPLPRRFSGTGYDKEFRVQGDFNSNVLVITPQTADLPIDRDNLSQYLNETVSSGEKQK